ncbi:MAG: SDR family oxidoreductase [Deltaproteobacteria bacterium]|nr:SDR family oxidoreductase [Deltaproteobacteria bacterium]
MSRIYLVTGGAGFIGCSIVRALLARGDRVRVIDNFSSGRRENLPAALPTSPASRKSSSTSTTALEVSEGDILNADDLKRAMEGVSVVFHHAAIASVPKSVADPVFTNEVNVTGTLQVLQAARSAGVQRVVYAASSSAYGNNPTLPKVESMAPLPQSPYAVTKLAGEFYCRSFYDVYGLQTVSLRYFNVFGPRQDPLSEYAAVIPRFIAAALNGKPVVIYGDGEQSRDFCFIDDVVAANLAAVEVADAAGGMFNIASGRAVSLNALLGALEPIIGRSIARIHEPPRVADVRHSLADITLARATMNYRPTVSLAEGLSRTVDWLRETAPGTTPSAVRI